MSPFLTPDEPPSNQYVVRRLLLPADNKWTSVFDGLLYDLCLQSNWEQDGEMTPADMADWFRERYAEFTTDFKETPHSDNAGDLDGAPDEPWYEQLYDWIIEGFLAITFTPQAAIVYHATVPKLRVAFRTGDIGALFKVLINGVEVWSGDSYAPIVDVIDQVFDTSALETPYVVRIEHNGAGENVTGDAKLEFIRNEAIADMIQTILRADPSGCGIQWSTDDGGTWETIDLSECITGLANEAIEQAVSDGTLGGSSQQPGATDIAQGECETYHVHLEAGKAWHCPVQIAAGYTIELENASGAWGDGGVHWFYPDGDFYVLGTKRPGKILVSADPLPTAYHMLPIGHYNTVYFNPGTLYTVPSGVTASDLFIQANDTPISDNLGAIDFDLTVCNEDTRWCVQFDFADTQTPFTVPYAYPGQGWTVGAYVADKGINATFHVDANYFSAYGADLALPEFVFTDVEVDYVIIGTGGGINLYIRNETTSLSGPYGLSGDVGWHRKSLSYASTWVADKHLWLYGASANATNYITAIRFRGTGTPPNFGSSCQ